MGVLGKARSLAHVFAAVLGLVSARPMAGEAPAQQRIQVAAIAAPSATKPSPGSSEQQPVNPAEPEILSYSIQWNAAAAAMAADRDVVARCQAAPETCPESARRFIALLHDARDKHGRARLGEVNRAVNLAIRFTSDAAQHGADLWTSPLETLAAGRGDCEDYAILKIMALRELGLAAADLRLMVLRDIRLQQDHAVALARLDGRWIVLDNRRLALLEPEDLPGYTAVASFETDGRPDPTLPLANAAARALRPGPSPAWPATMFNPS
ncbi:MAG TPA: transglutaminase-like cysteine peptidase [Beijerinckiaceae bacterium]|nr:transglutaminase-like cysteine peptidase [Beijerinckiaceae bacterium]